MDSKHFFIISHRASPSSSLRKQKMVGSTLLPKDVVMRLLRGYDFLTYNEQKGGGLDLQGKIGIKRLMFLSA